MWGARAHPPLPDPILHRTLPFTQYMCFFPLNSSFKIFRTLTNEGIEYLREFPHLPAEIVPATLKKTTRSAAQACANIFVQVDCRAILSGVHSILPPSIFIWLPHEVFKNFEEGCGSGRVVFFRGVRGDQFWPTICGLYRSTRQYFLFFAFLSMTKA